MRRQAILRTWPASKQAWEKEKKIRRAEAKADDLPRVLLKTSQGDIELELFENEAPNTRGELPHPGGKGLLQRPDVSSRVARFHGPGGRSEGGRQRRAGLQHRRRSSASRTTACTFAAAWRWPGRDAPDSAGSQFYLMFVPEEPVGRQVHGFRPDDQGVRGLGEDSASRPGEARSARRPDKIIKAEVLRKRPHKYEVKKVAE